MPITVDVRSVKKVSPEFHVAVKYGMSKRFIRVSW